MEPINNSTIMHDLSWMKSHLLLVALIVILVFGTVYGIESLIAKHDSARESKDTQILTLITAQTTDLKARMTQDESAASIRDAQYAATIAQLSGAIGRQNQALVQQIKVNATLTASQTAQAISQKTQAQPGEVSAQGDNVLLALPVARTINSDLDKLSTTLVQLDEKQKQLDAQTGLTTDAILDSVNGKKVITSLETQMAQADKVCKDTISTVKAQARKSKLKWFGIGYLLGLGSARFLGI